MDISEIKNKVDQAINDCLNEKGELSDVRGGWVQWRNGSEPLRFTPIGAVLIAACSIESKKSFLLPLPSAWPQIVANYLGLSLEVSNLLFKGFSEPLSSSWISLLSSDEREIYDLGASYRKTVKTVEPKTVVAKVVPSDWRGLNEKLNQLSFEERKFVNKKAVELGASYLNYCQALKEIENERT